MRRIGILFALVAFAFATASIAQEAGRKNALEENRAKIQASRKAKVESNLTLTADEAKAFWPLYDEYTAEVVKLGDRKSALITEFARNYEKLSDDQAKSMIKEQLDIQEQSLALRRATLKKMEGVLPPQKLVRFFQIDNKFDAEINSELAKMVPLAEPK
jgi:uncharacterized membrane-anchored protein YhcB (DUF1043 family)